MPGDIFNLFKNSIEQVNVKKTPRGTYDGGTDVYNVSLDAIVKRSTVMAEAVAESEDRNNRTSVHFRPTDKQYIDEGVFVEIDGKWHSIQEVRDGKNFHTGKTEFLYVFLDNDIAKFTNEPVWGQP